MPNAESARPPGVVAGVVAVPVHCRRCGYNLYGLACEGPCPECGLEVWESILHTIDPAASRLPALRDPAAVGDGLLWVIVSVTAASLLLIVRPLAQWIDALSTSGVRTIADLVPAWLPIAAAVLGAVAIWQAGRMAPPPGREPGGQIWRDLNRLRSGLAAWSGLVAAIGVLETSGRLAIAADVLWLAVAGAAVLVLLGLRGILQLIGLRSREYRNAQGGRQGLKAMIAAVVGCAAGQALRVAAELGGPEQLATLGVAISAISVLMVVIGLGYLVVNVSWIRRALRCPPPKIDEILGPPPA